MAQVAADPRPTRVPGVIPIEGRSLRLQRWVTVVMTVIPFAGFGWAVASIWGTGPAPLNLGLFAGFYLVSGLGITVGFHRLLAHKAFRARPAARAALALAGSAAVEGSVIAWVATHRRHHAFSDQAGDPHSPHTEQGFVRGLWHAHMGWLFDPEKTSQERWAPDLLKDPVVARIDRWFPRITLVSFVLPALVGFAATRSLSGTIGAFVWGSLARVFMLHHVTWSINSICHFFGTKPLKVDDQSRNNALLSLISFGESWHNNHHAFPSSSRLGLHWYQLDPGTWLIWTLERLRLVTDARRPDAEQYAAKLG